VREDTGALVIALEAHITTLKTELTCERAARHAARAAADKATAELVAVWIGAGGVEVMQCSVPNP
jgi:hypothetical protein